MTQATLADVKTLFEADFSLQNFAALRDAALATRENQRVLGELADGIDHNAGAAKALKKGAAYMILGRLQTAINVLQKAHPEEQVASIFLGKAHLDMEEPDEAKLVYREALAKHPDSRHTAYGLVFAMLSLNELDEAKEILARAKERFGQDEEITFLEGYHQELTGDYEGARKAYEAVLEEKPNHMRALFRLARWHQTWGEEEEALDLYETIRRHKPTFANALLNLGNLYEDFQRYDQAMDCYEEVLESIPNHSRAVMFLADARASKTMFYDEEGERRADRQSAILKIPVTDFELSVRSRNCLNKMNIKTLGDLIQMTEQDLLAHKNFGETSLMEVKQMLAQKGLRLGQGKIEGGSLRVPPRPMEVDEETLNQHIDALNLSVRSRKCMERLGIDMIGDLVSRTEAELLSAKNFGQTSLNEIKARLEERGLRLKDAPY